MPHQEQAKHFQQQIAELTVPQAEQYVATDILSDLLEQYAAILNQVIAGYRETGAQEDADPLEIVEQACVYFQLPALDQVLDDLSARIAAMKKVHHLLDTAQESLVAFLPPDERDTTLPDETNEQIAESEAAEATSSTNGEKSVITRVEQVLFIIIHELGIDIQPEQIYKGKIDGILNRTYPYWAFVIAEKNKLVLVSNEHENGTYIFDLSKVRETYSPYTDIFTCTKKQLRDFCTAEHGNGVLVIDQSHWFSNVLWHLQSEWLDQQKRVSPPKSERRNFAYEGEWARFWTDDEGKHWGTVASIVELSRTYNLQEGESEAKNRTISTSFWEKVITSGGLQPLAVYDAADNSRDAYCWEELLKIEGVQKRLSSPELIKNESGYFVHVDTEGKQWVTVRTAAQLLGITASRMSNIVQRNACHFMECYFRGNARKCYCVEQLRQLL